MAQEPVKSAIRTLFLLEKFANEQRPLSIGELSNLMDMPQSSTSVLVKSLVSLGYLEHDQTARTYYPTLRVALLGTWLRRRDKLTGSLPRILQNIADELNETTYVTMRNGIYSQHIVAQYPEDPQRIKIDSDWLYPLACTAPGWALLSDEPDVEIGKIIRRTKTEAPVEHWRNTAGDAIAKIQETRKNGFAFSSGQTVKEVSAISVLLQPYTGGKFAVSVAGRIERMSERRDQIVSTLKEILGGAEKDLEAKIANFPAT